MVALKDGEPKKSPTDRIRVLGRRIQALGKDYTAGLSRRQLQRLFDEEAPRAFSVLADRRGEPKQARDLVGIASSLKNAILGMGLKLSPARRILFLGSLLIPLLGLLDIDLRFGPVYLFLDTSPFWFLVSISGLILLVALELVDRIQVRDELEVAEELQRTLMPHHIPKLPGYAIAHSYRMAQEIGGDYYDLLRLEDGRVAIAVGDASGHGIGAGLLMAVGNTTLKTAVELDPSPESVLPLVHRALARLGGARAFMTLFYGLLDPQSGEFEFACAGHPFPLLRRRGGELEELGQGSFPLGLSRSPEVRAARVRLAPGDLLVLFSDGLPEAAGDDDEAFGFDRLRDLVSLDLPAKVLHGRILSAVDAHLGQHPLNDDLTVVVLERVGHVPVATS